jgi:hypothetical protein
LNHEIHGSTGGASGGLAGASVQRTSSKDEFNNPPRTQKFGHSHVLIAIVKKELQLDASLYTCLQILSVSVFEKTEISCALQADASQTDMPDAANQLNLFNF